jgi:hypothetical protein
MWLTLLEKSVIRALAWIIANKGLADVDHDGDVDFDDLWKTYQDVKQILVDAKIHFAGWDGWTRGQKIDAVIDYAKTHVGAGFKGTVIAALETVAYVVLWVTGQTK